jgi:hypothetical protein
MARHALHTALHRRRDLTGSRTRISTIISSDSSGTGIAFASAGVVLAFLFLLLMPILSIVYAANRKRKNIYIHSSTPWTRIRSLICLGAGKAFYSSISVQAPG